MWGIKEWLRISVILCTFGFFREMRPSEPFVMEFLSGEWRNITAEQVNREIYPIGSYSYLAQLVMIFLVTDMLRYKSIIILSAIAGIIMWTLMLWTTSIEALMVVQLFYGTFMASEVAYYTYLYAKVDKDKYQVVTGHTRSAILAGKFLGGVLGQILVSFELMNVRELNYVSFGSQIASLIFSVMLPSVKTSLYFYTLPASSATSLATIPDQSKPDSVDGTIELNYPKILMEKDKIENDANAGVDINTNTNKAIPIQPDLKPTFSWQRAYKLLWRHFIDAYSNPIVFQWSLWWALAMGGYLQVVSYAQVLWKQIDVDLENFYNGGVEAVMTLLSALGAFSAGFLNSGQYRNWDLWILTICSSFEGLLVIISALTDSVWVAYSVYVIFGIVYNFMITVASATVAKNLEEDSFGLIFGINTLVSLIVMTLMTLAVIANSGFALSPRGQFYAFGGYFLVLALIYAVTGFVSLCKRHGSLDVTKA